MATVIRQLKTGVFMTAFLTVTLIVFGRIPGSTTDPYVQAERMQQEILRYAEIQQKGGWPILTMAKKQYRIDESAPVIKQLKKRLQASGDLAGNDTSAVYTAELESAVKKAQRQFGFEENGIVDAAFIKSLNVPVEKRVQQLEINLARMQTITPTNSGKRIVVNIPEYKLHVYEGTTHVFDMNVVVGKESSKTATFENELTHIVFSPYWNVPTSIVRNEILPAMRRNRRYLASHGYEITGREGGLPKIRQKPGSRNSLGKVKFLFPNDHAIYFHDTPAKTLFRNRTRAYSHGCVRLEEPQKLAEYLLKEEAAWSPLKIRDAMDSGREQWVKLSASVPVSIIYLTAWVDHDGELNFRDDVYGLDNQMPIASVSK